MITQVGHLLYVIEMEAEREREREIMQLWDVGKSNRSDDDDYVDDM